MALIKCPECGQTVLSVATQCPKCSYLLASAEPGDTIEPNELMHCRHCNELFTRRAKRCPHCGQIQRRRTPIVVASVIGLGIVAAVAFALSRSGDDSLPAATIVQASPPTRAAVQVPPPVVDTETVVSEPEPPPPDPTPTVVTTTRFAQDWANVRAARTLQGDIIAILRPGQEVAVADRRGGWWSVYLGDSLVGYVSANLLTTEAPGDF